MAAASRQRRPTDPAMPVRSTLTPSLTPSFSRPTLVRSWIAFHLRDLRRRSARSVSRRARRAVSLAASTVSDAGAPARIVSAPPAAGSAPCPRAPAERSSLGKHGGASRACRLRHSGTRRALWLRVEPRRGPSARASGDRSSSSFAEYHSKIGLSPRSASPPPHGGRRFACPRARSRWRTCASMTSARRA
jgi:hypothetical protein